MVAQQPESSQNVIHPGDDMQPEYADPGPTAIGLERGSAVPGSELDTAIRALSEHLNPAWCAKHLPTSIPGMRERSYCAPAWVHHFNTQAGSAGLKFTMFDEDRSEHVHLKVLTDRIGICVMRALPAACGAGFTVRAADGVQIGSADPGAKRGLHPDKPHLGDLIVTVTLSGVCRIGVQQSMGDEREPQHMFTQTQGDFYAIFGKSRDYHRQPTNVKHQVIGGDDARCSLTLRFLTDPSPPPHAEDGERARKCARKALETEDRTVRRQSARTAQLAKPGRQMQTHDQAKLGESERSARSHIARAGGGGRRAA